MRSTTRAFAVIVAAAMLTTGCKTTEPQPATTQVAEQPAKWVDLFNGSDFGGWKFMDAQHNAWLTASKVTLDPKDNTRFEIIPGAGILVNGKEGKTTNACTELTHGDCEIHVEFMVPRNSNSGVYLQGRYEIQVFDSYGKDKVEFSDCGGIYARWINEQNVDGHAPAVNASKPPGEWQSFDAKFTAPRFDAEGKKTANARFDWVKHNGVLIHQNVELVGPTRAAMDEKTEVPQGPLMLQGDHGPVAYRNLRIKPLKTS